MHLKVSIIIIDNFFYKDKSKIFIKKKLGGRIINNLAVYKE